MWGDGVADATAWLAQARLCADAASGRVLWDVRRGGAARTDLRGHRAWEQGRARTARKVACDNRTLSEGKNSGIGRGHCSCPQEPGPPALGEEEAGEVLV